ncbi:uncharacterized protein LOC106875725 isoform X1 [Octopus bimaculoides]|uniref:uncharacterized protein LOC106875725 isoform X1 n=1 Tax=Octopus bimaculoides TaxID=37653 RepID=UPI00071D3B9E|nr:uncharacterized protein LOC106875725 isoform X1 [Octopus bimaculoides]|eukprot:XP_014779457.1 PREDICTED: uncharacterized protein LOC106875725 [Octopus bimaculoides]
MSGNGVGVAWVIVQSQQNFQLFVISTTAGDNDRPFFSPSHKSSSTQMERASLTLTVGGQPKTDADAKPKHKVVSYNYSSVERSREQVNFTFTITKSRALSSVVVYRNYDDCPEFEPLLWHKTTLFYSVGINPKQYITTVVIYQGEKPETFASKVFCDL